MGREDALANGDGPAFDPNEITFPNADALLLEITSVIQQVF